ncbi:transmembrane protein [Ceratobasidium sp. AG-Ba]|nr:transmembrane protein [Ceratobasidium sp. AG-Ba]
MASDSPGEELAPDATIWKLYLEEAAEHDQELVDGRHKSLDMLLLFAALFSAVLSAFLIESKDLLQADPAETSANLLILIAQSQYRMEHGLPPSSDSPDMISNFTPTTLARWVNGLWFTSLGLSLSTALIAMLGKEWLTTFLASRPRPAHAHALLLGLVLYLWTFDVPSAIVLTAITGITTLFYLLTAILGAIYDYCPFVTELSGYVRKATVALFDWKQDKNSGSGPNETSQKEMQALRWLANNARDPAVVDCSYQSLAGLNGPAQTNRSDHSNSSLSLTKFDSTSIPMEVLPDISFSSFLDIVIRRYNHPSTSPLHPNNSDITGLTDCIWSNDCRSLTTTVYAEILVAECNALLITSSMVKLPHHSAVLGPGEDFVNQSIKHPTSDDTPLHAIDIPASSLGDLPPHKVLHDMRRYYTQWLLRVSCLLRFYSQNKITIDGRAVNSVLNALGLVAQSKILNPRHMISTHLTQADELGYATYQCSIQLGNIGSFVERRETLYFEPLAILISLLENRPGIKEGSSVQACLAILKAYSRLAPVLLQQVLDLPNRDYMAREFDIDDWPKAHKSSMVGIRYICTRLMLLTFNYMGLSKTKVLEYLDFCKTIISFTEPCAVEDNRIGSWTGSHQARLEHAYGLVPFLEFLDEDSSVIDRVPGRIKYRLVVMSGYRNQDGVSVCQNHLTPRCFPVLLSLLSTSGASTFSAGDMLSGMMRRIQGINHGKFSTIPWDNNQAIDYLHQFSCGSKGFSAIASAYTNAYADGVADLALTITQIASGEHPSTPDMQASLDTPAVPGFLQVLDIVVKHCSKKREPIKLSQFIGAALNLLLPACANPDSRKLISESSACQILWDALVSLGNQDTSRSLASRMHELALGTGIVLSGANAAPI